MPRFFIDEPTPQLAALMADALISKGCDLAVQPGSMRLDASAYLHDESQLLDSEELRDAEAALIEDGIFTAPGLAAKSGEELRAAIKYGWVLAVAQQAGEASLELSVDAGAVATTVAEHRFLVAEIERRRLKIGTLALCLPAPLEPAIALRDGLAEVVAWLADHQGIGGPALAFAHGEMKEDLLAAIAKHAPGAQVGLHRVAWLECLRVLSREEPSLFRECLVIAQDRFALEKGTRISETTEDDIHALPQVEDDALEAIFLDDYRGRQLLYTSAPALAADPRLSAFFGRSRADIASLVEAAASRYAAALRA